ncbi:MAG: hypothetical protein IJB09_06915 [Oscillospiraceae bacterium]|nr:hypothetical protein [Oscillospiraceae bacterium]
MAKGKHEAPSKRRISASITHSRRRPISAPASRRRRRSGVKLLPLAAALVLIIGVAAGSTMAYLTDESAALSGSYTAGVVDCEVQSDYSVENTGNVAAYVRVTLVQNYVDGAGNVCSAHEDITPANPAGWVYQDGFYYYTQILAPGSATVPAASSDLHEADDGCTVKTTLYAQVIQAEPAHAITDAWDYSPAA